MKRAIFVLIAVILFTNNIHAGLTDGLVGYWPFSGNANDESGLGNHGTVSGAVLVLDRLSNPDSAYNFDGIDDYIDIGDVELVTGNQLSVQAWFNTTALLYNPGWVNQGRPLVSKLWGGVAYHLGGSIYDDNKIEFSVNSSYYRVESNAELNDGLWHHVVGVYDGTLSSDNIKLYVDGVPQTMTFDYTDDIYNVSESLSFGANDDGRGDFYEGLIDDIRIYDRALTQAEVIELYEPTIPPIADAGPDQAVIDTDSNGSELITLDGSSSSDTDGSIISWVWTDDLGDTIPDGEIVTVTLPVGTHTITLTVTDDDGLTDTDTVVVIIQSLPVADAGEDIIADADEEVILDASASYDPDGDITQYMWTALPEEEVLYSGEENAFTTKALGRVEEVIKLTVTDNDGHSSEDTVSILNRRVEEIELTPGPEGPQGEQGPPGITPEEVAQMQAQIAALQQIVEQNRSAMEQFNPLRKLLEELEPTQSILGDINLDGRVDSADLAIITSNWLEGTQ